jgi:hypothetical protein
VPFGPQSRIGEILRNPEARSIAAEAFPELFDSPLLQQAAGISLEFLVERMPQLRSDPERLESLWAALAAVHDLRAGADAEAEPESPVPDPNYEDAAVPEGSAVVTAARAGTCWSPYDVVLQGPSHGNPFTDVELAATFTNGQRRVQVGGFYDGEGRWVVRFGTGETGTWRFETNSNARSLNGISGEFEMGEAASGVRGPVRAEGFHFVHADGTRHTPLGTTAYAWVHQPAPVQEATLRTLAGGPFTKLRMTVFPKSYDYNSNEPGRFAFVRDATGDFDFTRFDPAFFRLLEARVRELGELGIEADLILFHPYDRWGFMDMGRVADDRYARYVVRRLAALPNVWWSMANEYDFVWTKSDDDWDRLGRLVAGEDFVGHLISVHNGLRFFDHGVDWITHASIQRVDTDKTAESVDEWRERWGKPVVVDECGYEGDLPHGWGNLTGRELVRRFWEAALRGGYLGHGETYWREDEQIWWAKGGALVGESPARIAFLREIVAAAPGGVLEPVPLDYEAPSAGVAGEYYLVYVGGGRQPRSRSLRLPPGRVYRVEVIDTWNMTIETLPGTVAGTCTVPLPGREFMALRLTAVVDAAG